MARSQPLTFTQNFVLHQREQIAERRLSSPREASMRPMWSITTGTGERSSAGASSPIALGRHVNLQMPADIGKPLAERDHLVDRRALGEMFHVMEARAAEALRVDGA